MLDGPGPRLVAVRDRGSDAGAPGLGEEAGAEPDQAARWHDELDAHPARAVVGHGLHAALALREELGDRAEVLLRGVDGEPLHRLIERQPEDPHQLLLEEERQEGIGLDGSRLVAVRGARRGLARFAHPFEDTIHHLA